MERRGAPPPRPPARVRPNFLPRPRPAPSAEIGSSRSVRAGRAACSRRSGSHRTARQPRVPRPQARLRPARDPSRSPRSAAREDAAAPGMASLALWSVAPEEGKGKPGWSGSAGVRNAKVPECEGLRALAPPLARRVPTLRRAADADRQTPRPRTGALLGPSWLRVGGGCRGGGPTWIWLPAWRGRGRSPTRECARLSGSARQTDKPAGCQPCRLSAPTSLAFLAVCPSTPPPRLPISLLCTCHNAR